MGFAAFVDFVSKKIHFKLVYARCRCLYHADYSTLNARHIRSSKFAFLRFSCMIKLKKCTVICSINQFLCVYFYSVCYPVIIKAKPDFYYVAISMNEQISFSNIAITYRRTMINHKMCNFYSICCDVCIK